MTSAAPTWGLAPVFIGILWMGVGDSEMDGRTPDSNNPCHTPMDAFRNVLNENEGAGVSSWTKVALGGAILAEHHTRYLASGSRGTRTWVYSQESGEQSGSQATAAGFKADFKAYIIAVRANSPSAVISFETANSFNREAEGDRNWTSYNVVLREAIAELQAEEGITVYLSEADATIELLEAALTPADVWYQNPDVRGPYAHYTPLGNFALALSKCIALGRDPRTMTFASITDVTTPHKTAAVAAAVAAAGI
jgi:hypothetical protein